MSMETSFSERMEAGRDAAAYRRHRGESRGNGAMVRTASQVHREWLERYPDPDERAEAEAAERATWAEIYGPDYGPDDIDGDLENVGSGLQSAPRATAAVSAPQGKAESSRQHKGATMTGKEYKAACAALGISVYASAKLLGFSLRTVQRFSSGETEVPKVVALVLRLMLKHGETRETVESAEKPKRKR